MADNTQLLVDINKNLGELNGKIELLIKQQEKDSEAQWQAINANRQDITSIKVKSAGISGIVSLATALISEIVRGNAGG